MVPDASNVIYVHCNRLSECLCASEAHSILRCVRTRCGANGDKQVSGCRKHVSLLTTQQDSYLLLVQTPICTRSSLVMIARMTSRCLNTCMERSLLNQRDMKLLTSSAAAKQGRDTSCCRTRSQLHILYKIDSSQRTKAPQEDTSSVTNDRKMRNVHVHMTFGNFGFVSFSGRFT